MVRPGAPLPDMASEMHAVLALIVGETPPPAFDEQALVHELKRSCGVYLAVGEPSWRWHTAGALGRGSDTHYRPPGVSLLQPPFRPLPLPAASKDP